MNRKRIRQGTVIITVLAIAVGMLAAVATPAATVVQNCKRNELCCWGQYLHCYIDCRDVGDCLYGCWRTYKHCTGEWSK